MGPLDLFAHLRAFDNHLRSYRAEPRFGWKPTHFNDIERYYRSLSDTLKGIFIKWGVGPLYGLQGSFALDLDVGEGRFHRHTYEQPGPWLGAFALPSQLPPLQSDVPNVIALCSCQLKRIADEGPVLDIINAATEPEQVCGLLTRVDRAAIEVAPFREEAVGDDPRTALRSLRKHIKAYSAALRKLGVDAPLALAYEWQCARCIIALLEKSAVGQPPLPELPEVAADAHWAATLNSLASWVDAAELALAVETVHEDKDNGAVAPLKPPLQVPEGGAPPAPPGPFTEGKFRWADKEIDEITGSPWKLLNCLWDHGEQKPRVRVSVAEAYASYTPAGKTLLRGGRRKRRKGKVPTDRRSVEIMVRKLDNDLRAARVPFAARFLTRGGDEIALFSRPTPLSRAA